MKLKVLRPARAPIGKQRLLPMLAAAFGNDDFERCRIIVAFAKRGGVRQLLPHIAPFRARGHSVSVVVGVDVRGTSIEALQLLLAGVNDAYVTYDPDPRCTFHPKMFLFDGPKRALAFVGSHNMTAGGLELNYEAGVAVDLDLDLPADVVTWTKGFETSWTELMPAHPSTAPLTQSLIDDLVAAGLVVSEEQLQKERKAGKAVAAASGVKLPFGSAGVAPATVVAAAPKPPTATGPVPPGAGAPVNLAAATVPGPVAWQKTLSATDAQRQTGHPTGDLRLVQAKFEVHGQVINQTTYFRNSVFPGSAWSVETQSPLVETADFDFDITILGKAYGVHRLTVSHKPSGAAGQGNYTTGLRWGDLRQELRSKVNVRGKTLTLSAPPPGKTTPYFISIA